MNHTHSHSSDSVTHTLMDICQTFTQDGKDII